MTSASPAGSLLDRFDLVVVINLDRRPDRLREMEAQLARIGAAFGERVVRLAASAPADPGGFPSIGARGCFESHMRALRLAITRNARSVLILEDDCDFTDGFMAYLERMLDFDLFYGGQYPDGTGAHCIGFHGTSIIAGAHRRLSQMSRRRPGDPRGGPMHVDGAYHWIRRDMSLLTVIANPPVAVQRASRSDIADLRWFDRMPGAKSLAGLARALKRWLRA